MLKKAPNMISRRQSFALGAAGAALLNNAITAEAFAGGAAEFSKDSLFEGARPSAGIHNGKGTVTVKFFRFSGDPAPANFLIYDGKIVPVKMGDYVHTPLTVAHGIENTGSENLKVFLTFIRRA